MTATNITRTVGIDKSSIEVGTSTTVTASADSTTPAIDDVVSGDASATAATTAQAAILNSRIKIGTAGTLNAVEDGTVGAAATTTSGDATASASNNGPTGGIINSTHHPNQIQVGTNAVVTSTATNDALAVAEAVDGASSASANAGKVFGMKNVGLNAGQGTSLTASATGTSTAAAESVGLPPGSGASNATAGAYDAKVVGIYASGAKPGEMPPPTDEDAASASYGGEKKPLSISFGTSGTVSAFGTGGFDASATSVTGAAAAQSRAKLVAGIAVGPDKLPSTTGASADQGEPAQPSPGGLVMSFGENGAVAAQGSVGNGGVGARATAETVTGPAAATVGITTIGGIVDVNRLGNPSLSNGPGSSTILTVGKDGDIQAAAVGNSAASAKAVTAPANVDVSATTNHNNVVGIAIDKLAIGENATRLFAQGFSKQAATAQSTTSGGDPIAGAANGDFVAGVHATTITVGRNATDPVADASLNASATAGAVTTTAGSTALAGNGSTVVGFNQSSLAIGENVLGTGVFGATAASDLAAGASATTGDTTARAGGSGSSVIGLNASPVTIGKAGSVAGSASGTVGATAASVTGDALAEAAQKARGIKDSKIAIGTDGNATGTAGLTGTASATTTTGDADAATNLSAKGIDNDVTIAIGKAGNVTGTATVTDSRTLASAVTGATDASSDLKAIGIHLGNTKVTIGTTGNTTGTATAAAPSVLSTTTTGDASVGVEQTAIGIKGSGYGLEALSSMGGSAISAGLAGNVVGRGTGSALGTANTITGAALAGTDAFIAGIKKVDLSADNVTAEAQGTYGTNAMAVTGDATASSNVKVAGLLGNWNNASLNGDLRATARLVNEVMASTTTGMATATANSDVVGMSGYQINILQSGNITASAVSETLAQASTVTV